MFEEIIPSFFLLALCVCIHAVGLTAMTHTLLAKKSKKPARFLKQTWILICVAWGLIILHTLEIGIWALYYFWKGCLPDGETAFYFSGVTYATVGYGDVVLPQASRMLSLFEGLTGILMCGLSTAFFFAVILRIVTPKSDKGV
ncbi:MAG: hypothetical protein RL693_1976 [Verrucomicrobiota bacterium]|jgi:hypothetical protein